MKGCKRIITIETENLSPYEVYVTKDKGFAFNKFSSRDAAEAYIERVRQGLEAGYWTQIDLVVRVASHDNKGKRT